MSDVRIAHEEHFKRNDARLAAHDDDICMLKNDVSSIYQTQARQQTIIDNLLDLVRQFAEMKDIQNLEKSIIRIEKTLERIDQRVDQLEGMPAKRYETAIASVIAALAGSFITFFITKILGG